MAALGLRPEDVLRKFLLLPMKIICMDLNRIIVQIIKDRMFGFQEKVDWFMIYIKLEFQLIQGTQTDEELMVMSFHEDNI